MLREERLRFILNKLQQNTRVTSAGLSSELSVSDDTIRRDLNELAAQGLLRKVHGGALPRRAIPDADSPKDYYGRLRYAQAGKHVLAQKALSLLRPEMIIILDGGTTNLEVARLLPPDFSAIVYTNSFPIVGELISRSEVQIEFLGGTVSRHSQVAVGHYGGKGLSHVRADVLLLGARSVHPEVGITVHEREEARLKRKMVARSSRVVLPVTREKLNTASHYNVCDIMSIDTLITEEKVPEEEIAPYRELGIALL